MKFHMFFYQSVLDFLALSSEFPPRSPKAGSKAVKSSRLRRSTAFYGVLQRSTSKPNVSAMISACSAPESLDSFLKPPDLLSNNLHGNARACMPSAYFCGGTVLMPLHISGKPSRVPNMNSSARNRRMPMSMCVCVLVCVICKTETSTVNRQCEASYMYGLK